MKSSRRNFLLTAVTAPLAASLNPEGHAALEILAAIPPAGQMQFENPQLIRYDSKCFTFREKDTLVMSAAFHYPRCPKALWRDRLQKFRMAGFNTIETYVFWNYHEEVQGKYDWSGNRNLRRFVQLCAKHGLYCVIRLGPWSHGEWGYDNGDSL